MKDEKLWFGMSEEEWEEERKRIRKIQDRHFQNGIPSEGR